MAFCNSSGDLSPVSSIAATVTYVESVQGDLPTYRNPPSLIAQFDLGIGNNTFSGSMATTCCGGDFDTISFSIPAGAKLTSVLISYQTFPAATNRFDDMTYGMEFSYGTMPYFAYAGTAYAPALVLYLANEGCCEPVTKIQKPLFSSALPLGEGNYTLDFSNVSNPAAGKIFTYQITFVVSDATAPMPPSYSLSPQSLSFGTIQTNSTSASKSIALSSSGGLLTVSSVVLEGTNPGDFIISGNTCRGPQAAGQGCSFSIAFSPLAPAVRSASLRISSNAATQFVSLVGTGGLPLASSSTKVDTKCVSTFSSLLFDNKSICDVIHYLRDWFGVSRADASNDELYAWINANRASASAFVNFINYGLMVDKYKRTQVWDNDALTLELDEVISAGRPLLALNEAMLDYISQTSSPSPGISFISNTLRIFRPIQNFISAYSAASSIMRDADGYNVMMMYISDRCGQLVNGTCSGNQSQTLVIAQEAIKALGVANTLLCIKNTFSHLTARTCSPSAVEIQAYLDFLELHYQAYRLVAFADSSQIRRDLGTALVSVIKNP